MSKIKFNKKIVRGLVMLVISSVFLVGVGMYVYNHTGFLLNTAFVEHMTDPVLTKNKRILVLRKNFLHSKRKLKEGDLIAYKKYDKYLVGRVASLKNAKYYNSWNSNIFQHNNIRIAPKKKTKFNHTNKLFNTSYGVMNLSGYTVRQDKIIVVSDETDPENGAVVNYTGIDNFIGWVYPLNKETVQKIINIWKK